jgi:NADPH:quinone reductase-like Zn-dependent oxidoreductase
MKAVGVTRFGGPEALEVVEVPEPHAGPDQVRIRVRAAAVNPADALMRAGALAAMLEGDPPHVPGRDCAGTIDEVGEGAPWRVGDRVVAIVEPSGGIGGAYAEYVVVPADAVGPMPEGSDFVSACTLPMNGLTARTSLDQLALTPGQTLAVTGAAGAYGGYVVQLAKADGLRVLADASDADAEIVAALGADVVVPRGPDVAAGFRRAAPEGVDGLADGAVQNDAVIAAVRDGGAFAAARGPGPAPERDIVVHVTRVSSFPDKAKGLAALCGQVEAGAVTLRVAATYRPEQASEAHARLEAGGTRGRLVITF